MRLGGLACACALLWPLAAMADDDDAAPENWSAHAQLTGIYQAYPAFPAAYTGPLSLPNQTDIRETISATAFLGARLPWQGGEFYFNPEAQQGFGVGSTHGIDGFPNGEAVKAGFDTPKPNVARLYLHQMFGLGGGTTKLDPDSNQLGETVDAKRIVVTAGKFAAPDIFDMNQYAHDPRKDFLNGSFWESDAWDYPADTKGYTDGIAVEWITPDWSLRGGLLMEPKIANERDLDARLWLHYGSVAELELPHQWWGEDGKLRLLVFANRTPQADLSAATAAALAAGMPATVVPFRMDHWKVGFALNLEQAVTDELGLFARASYNNGRTEGWAFTDIDRSIGLGASLKGKGWGRDDDTVGVAAAANALSTVAVQYFNAGGTGILTGDGHISYSPEMILETYYSIKLAEPASLTFDYQFVNNPAFNTARGPVSLFAARVHIEY